MARRTRLKVNAREWASSPYWRKIETGSDVPASKYLRQANISPGDRVVVVGRASFRSYKDHTDDQAASIREAVEAAGGIVVKTFAHVGPTKGADWYDFVAEVASYCKRRNAIPVAETADRWCRHWDFDVADDGECAVPDTISKTRKPNDDQFTNLLEAAAGVQLFTLYDPDLTARQARSVQIKRGQRASGNQGGIPRKRKRGPYRTGRKAELLPVIAALFDDGVSKKEIARRLGTDRRNVIRWLNEHNAPPSSPLNHCRKHDNSPVFPPPRSHAGSQGPAFAQQ